ncbi:flippase [Methanobacterium sp. SMA-27]|uniref:flippase n=1 Tax=Methanobacterium sp. SMA-27 TaxID=1495336 RepID=UPI00064E5C44|nr:flippase [Methanobacterium sp. SMA-27]
MNATQKLTKNIGSLFTSQSLSYLISLIYTIYLVRYLGVVNYGILSFALALTSILGIFADFGLNTLMTRELAIEKSLTNKYLNNIFSIKLLEVSILLILIILIVQIVGYPQQTVFVLYIMMIFLIFNTFSTFFSSLFQAYEKLEYQSIATVLNSLLMLVGILILIHYNNNLITFTLLYAIIGGVILIYYLFVSTTKFEFPLPKIEIDWNFWKPTIKTAAQFGLIGVFVTIYVWIDSVMLSFMQGNQAVGLYNAAYRIVLLLLFIPTVINAAIFPVMSRLYGSSSNSLSKIVEKYFKFMILIGIPIGVAITLLSSQIIIMIFGNAFLESTPALQILVWATVFTFGNAAFVQLFQSTDKQILLTKITFIGMIINITLNVILIPKFSYIAASFNTLITEFIILALVLILAKRLGYIKNGKGLIKDSIIITISSLIMGIFIWEFKDYNLLILILTSAFIYLIILFALKGINNDDINIIRNMRN